MRIQHVGFDSALIRRLQGIGRESLVDLSDSLLAMMALGREWFSFYKEVNRYGRGLSTGPINLSST